MKAAWDWQLPRDTDAERREVVAVASDCGFDTLITPAPTAAMADAAADNGLTLLGIVGAYPSDAFREAHPEAIQRVHPVEREIVEVLAERAPEDYQQRSHRRYPVVHDHTAFCFEHPASVAALEDRIEATLAVADGVAFDGIGFRNQYACFCERCREERERRTENAHAGEDDRGAILRAHAEETLVDVTASLSEHATAIDPDALVTSHVWPPFRPNRTYAHRLRLDYCAQTIAWFYPPAWSIERVEFEAATHDRLETPGNNRFAPFVGLFDDPNYRRSASRLQAELEIAVEYGGGNLVVATLEPLARNEAHRAVVRDALASCSGSGA